MIRSEIGSEVHKNVSKIVSKIRSEMNQKLDKLMDQKMDTNEWKIGSEVDQKWIKNWSKMDQTFILDSQRAADVMITSISASFNACATAASPNVA